MKTRRIVLVLLALTAGQALAAPTYPCYHPTVTPVIDGEVAGDPAWQSLPAVTGFSVLGDGYSYTKQTLARLCWTVEGLYIGVLCEEPDAKLLKPKVLDGGDTWAEDGIEIFLQPAGRPEVYQFAVTAGGARGGFEGNPDTTKMRAAAKIGEDTYSLEALIPFDVVRGRAAEGVKWTGNLCRNIFTTRSGGDKFTSWAPLKARFLEPENFAAIVFHDSSLSTAEVEKVTEQLNSPYRRTLLKQVSQAAKAFSEYRQGLELAAQDAEYAGRAAALLSDWRRLEEMSRQANRASILDMRAALVKLEALNRDSYEVKYDYLIHKLLEEN
ncbi:carbohydrate-binding family 9-like protein [bacterium]|nr:carbohydrate-binding family 9-like protein [bacterium]